MLLVVGQVGFMKGKFQRTSRVPPQGVGTMVTVLPLTEGVLGGRVVGAGRQVTSWTC